MHKPEKHPTLASAPPETTRKASGSGCLIRLTWLLLGNVALLVFAILILEHKGSFLSLNDLGFWATVGLLIPIRYVDVVCLHGLTASGEPATTSHLRKYVLVLLSGSAAAWALAHAAAYLGA